MLSELIKYETRYSIRIYFAVSLQVSINTQCFIRENTWDEATLEGLTGNIELYSYISDQLREVSNV